MSSTFKSLGKRASAAAIVLLLLGSGVAPAEAAVAGSKCTKANAKTKIGGESFICTTNPNTKSKRLVWVWADCLLANTAYLKGIESQKNLTATADQTIEMLKADIEKLKVDIAAREPEAKTWDAKAADYRKRAAAAINKATEYKTNAAKDGVTSLPSNGKREWQRVLLSRPANKQISKENPLTSAEQNQLATVWGVAPEKVPAILLLIAAEDLANESKYFESGAKNADRKAASLRSTNLIDIKERQIRSAETNVRLANSQISSLKSTVETACSVQVWKAIS